MKPDYTPEKISHLDEGEIFVFGSNLNGNHAGGAARVANELFGAEWGVGEGMTGKTYALPTLDRDMKCVAPEVLYESFKRFINIVQKNPHFTFYLTKVGCGIAGWSLDDVRKIFWESVGDLRNLPHNLVIPYEFYYERTQQKIAHEEELREKLSKAARQAVNEEEREMYYNQIVDTESAIECMRDELKMYD